MNKKEILDITTYIIQYRCSYHTDYDCKTVAYEVAKNPNFVNKIINYLKSLSLDYEFVKDILTNDYGSSFYHLEFGENSIPLPKKYNKNDLVQSEHDDQIWIDKNGRVGVWCEVDGFVAWLDEYKTVWIVDSREEVERDREKSKKLIDEMFKNIRWDFE